MKKAPKSCGCVTLSRSVLRKAEWNCSNCSDEKKREYFSENFHSLSVLKYGICSLFPLKNCSNRGFSGLVVDWRQQSVCIVDSCASFWSRSDRTGETIYSAEHLHETQNKITEDTSEKTNRISCYMAWVQFWNAWYNKICSSAVGEKSGKLE